MARRRSRSASSKSRMAYVRSFRKNAPKRRRKSTRRRTARRNPFPVAGLVVNPRRRRRSVVRAVSRRRRSRRYQRNPQIMGFSLPPLKSVAFAGAGFVGTPIVEGFANRFLPVSITSNQFGKYAVKIVSVIALSYAAKKVVGQEEGKMVGIGGGVYVASCLFNDFAPANLKTMMGLSAYVQPGMGSYVRGTGSNMQQLGALPTAGGAAFGRGNSAIGGTAERFRKF